MNLQEKTNEFFGKWKYGSSSVLGRIRKRYYYYLNRFFLRDLNRVEIETTTICNLKCPYCPNSIEKRPQAYMSEKLFLSTIDSLRRRNFSGVIAPHFYGEPLVDERIVGFVRYIRDNLPKAKTEIYTNGTMLDFGKYLQLRDAGVDLFVVSQHTKEPSEAISSLMRESIINNKKVDGIIYLNQYEAYRSDRTDDFSNRGGIIRIENKRTSFCYAVNQMTIDYEGNAVLCCNDYNSSVVFGNVGQRDVYEIWNDPRYVDSREKILGGKFIYEICRKCTSPIPFR